jgi:hypothetical protein
VRLKGIGLWKRVLNPWLSRADKPEVRYRRREERNECAQLINVVYKDDAGRKRKLPAVLEDISPGGACLMLEEPIPPDTAISLLYPNGRYYGRVKYCELKPTGYFAGIEFESGYRWSRRQFKPEHLLQFKVRPNNGE